MSLRARVMALFIPLHLGIMAFATWTLVVNARAAVEEEVNSNVDFAREFALSMILSRLASKHPADIMRGLQQSLPPARHARLTLTDALGNPLRSNIVEPTLADEADAPEWFYRLVAPETIRISLPIGQGLTRYGTLDISTEPSDEINEVWTDVREMLVLLALAFGALLVVIYFLLGRALAPIAIISAGLEGLEQGRYDIRLPVVPVPDLRKIAEKFNALAGTLEYTTNEKDRLGRQMINLQDNERKSIALDLHDEFGPCLFGIRVDALTISTSAAKADPELSEQLSERAQSILSITNRLQQHSRSMLKRLRPMSIGVLPLEAVLEDLVESFPNDEVIIDWRVMLPESKTTFGETVDLTIYRLTQECLTNSIRHGAPTLITITLQLDETGSILLEIVDDGHGISSQSTPGRGLDGMRQRVAILGGRFSVRSDSNSGTTVTAWIPESALNEGDESAESTMTETIYTDTEARNDSGTSAS